MAPELPPDFSEFLKLLNAHGVSYLIIGGYAVGFHGHPRATADIDIWVPRETETAHRLVSAIREFGFEAPELSADLFVRPDQVVRLGVPPLRIELLTTIAGVEFEECAPRAVITELGGVSVRIIALTDLKRNKRAAGRHQDLADLEHLP
ncbi:MAG TPA: nucleotidyltransferase [Vicinamibacterales bacterium]|nr:nucleotidyltransferase [Vicinamibacterales bacterium]